ncbi:MAG: matrixin family metalloprotease [Brevundimonas sp.]
MTAPDDLPRSPTGRVPQWVLDEAFGSPAPPVQWRESDAVILEAPRRRNRVTTVITVLVLVLVLALTMSWRSVKNMSAPGWPPAGQGEQRAPLGEPATVVWPSTSYAFRNVQTAAGVPAGPVTWSPCRPIHYVVNPASGPGRFVADVASVVEELSTITGLRFVYDGLSDEPAADQREVYQRDRYGNRWAPVLVQFASQADVSELAGEVAGLGGSTAVADPKTGALTYVSGYVQIDADILTFPDIGGGPAYVAILRHELGHVLGLDHVDDYRQIMNPRASQWIPDYKAGDISGLAELGKGACAPGV